MGDYFSQLHVQHVQRRRARTRYKVHVAVILRHLRIPSDAIPFVLNLLFVPTISISQNTLSFELVSQTHAIELVVDMADFEDALSWFDKRPRHLFTMGARWFFALFECRGRRLNIVDVFEKMCEENLLDQVFDLEIMDWKYEWARIVRSGFNHICDFIIAEAYLDHRPDIVHYAEVCKQIYVLPFLHKYLFKDIDDFQAAIARDEPASWRFS